MNTENKLNEVTYEDAYGEEFVKFKKKYNKFKKDSSLYVQFTNFDLGVDNRKGYESPDHRDPVGVYAYPLWYVIDYPSDIWYGQKASFMRVLKETNPRRTLNLQFVTYSDIGNFEHKLRRTPYERSIPSGLISKLEKEFKGASQYGQIFFNLLQRDYTKKTETKDFGIRTGKEQTGILRALGYWAIEDTASRQVQSVINDREPVQICFLVPSAFKVIDIYQLKNTSHSSSERGSHRAITTEKLTDVFLRFVAQKVLKEVFNDKIDSNQKDGYYSTKVHFYNTYFSKGGRKIVVDAVDTIDRSSLKLGQKPFKAYKKSNRWALEVNVLSEYGEIDYKSYTDEPINDMISYFKAKVSESEIDPDWKPMSKEGYIQSQESEYDAEMDKRIEAERQEAIKEYSDMRLRWDELASLLNVNVSYPISTDEEKLVFVKTANSISNTMWHKKSHVFDGKVVPLEDLIPFNFIEYLKDHTDSRYAIFSEYFLPILRAAQPYLTNYTLPSHGMPWALIRDINEKNEISS